MKIFYDWEMLERGAGMPIVPVSLAMVREDGAHMYAINEGCLSGVVHHPWLSLNVVPHLPIKFDNSSIYYWDKDHPDYFRVVSVDAIAAEALRFIRETVKLSDGREVELWADCGAYDHVVLCQLWGTMAEKPAGVPYYTNDIQQELRRLRDEGVSVELPPTPEHNHHALADALWAMDAYNAIFDLAPRVVDAVEVVDEVTDETINPVVILDEGQFNTLMRSLDGPPTPIDLTGLRYGD